MVKSVGPGLAVVEMWWRDPFGGCVFAFSGGPAALGQWVMAAAGKGEVVDVGDAALRVGGDMMHLTVIAGHIAARVRAATILGVQHVP